MDMTLSDMEYLVLIRSIHTKDIPTIAQSILRVERVLNHIRSMLAAQDSSLTGLHVAGPTVQVSELVMCMTRTHSDKRCGCIEEY